MFDNTKFALRLREAREEQNITQAQFAAEINVSRVTLTHYEAGDRTPDIDTLKKICQFTNISPNYFLGLSDSKTDSFKGAVQLTGLSEPAIRQLENYAQGAKVLNHLITSGAFRSFVKRAIIVHDNTLLQANRPLPLRVQRANDRELQALEDELAALTITIFKELGNTNEFLDDPKNEQLPYNMVIELINNCLSISSSLKQSIEKLEKKIVGEEVLTPYKKDIETYIKLFAEYAEEVKSAEETPE